MKCPHCQQELEAGLPTCPACGKTLDPAALESLQQVEALLAWLDERAEALGPEAYERLRSEALKQQRALSDRLGRPGELPVAPPTSPARTTREVIRELALLEAAIEQLQYWKETAVIGSPVAGRLSEHLSARAEELDRELLGRPPGESEQVWNLRLLNFFQKSLPQWARTLRLRLTEVTTLQEHLDRQFSTLLQSCSGELACLDSALQQVDRWAELGAADRAPAAQQLRLHLLAQIGSLESGLAGHPVPSEPVSDQQVLDYALEALPQWSKALRLSPDDVASLRDHLNAQSTERLQAIAQELALVKAAREQVQQWQQARAIAPTLASDLHNLLSERSQELKTKLTGQPVEAEPPWLLQVLDYALSLLPQCARTAKLHPWAIQSFDSHLRQQQAALLQRSASSLARLESVLPEIERWLEAGVIGRISANGLRRHLSDQAESLKQRLAGLTLEPSPPVEGEPPSELQTVSHSLNSLSLWARGGHIQPGDVESLRAHLSARRSQLLPEAVEVLPIPAVAEVPAAALPAEPQPVPTVAAAPAPPPRPVAKPAAPPKPAKPPREPIDWSKVWERTWTFVVSGALLRALLYLGAFMIVVAAGVLVANFWNDLPSWVQGIIIFSVPTGFYIAGWVVRTKMNLPQAGGTLNGIGALLVAVDFAGIYQFGGLELPLEPYWLVTSLICTVLYAVTAWRLPGEFFGYITLVALNSAVMALSITLRLPLEWGIALLMVLAAVTVEGAVRLGRLADKWHELALAARRLPLVLIPTGQFLILLLTGIPLVEPSALTLGHAAVFLFASAGYGLLVWRFPKSRMVAILAHAAVWSSVGAVGLALWATALPWAWYPTAAAVLAPLYALARRGLERWLDDEFPARRDCLAALNGASFALLGAAILVGITVVPLGYTWEGVVALTLSSLALSGYAYLYRRPQIVLPAGALFIAPFSLAAHRWLLDFQVPQWGAWLMTAWAGLALAYLGLAVLLRAAKEYGAWLNLLAHILAPATLAGLPIQYAVTVDRWFAGPTLAALGGVLLVYVTSAAIHDSGRHPALSGYLTWLTGSLEQNVFLWPAGLILPVWIAVAWSGNRLSLPWEGAVLAGLGLAYVGLGQLLARRKVAYRLPPHVYAYGLSLVAIIVAFGDARALTIALYVVVGVLAALARSYRRVVETTLAALLFIWPFQLTLELLSSEWPTFTPHAYSLAYALLAGLAYVPLGIELDRAGRKYALPTYLVGYGLAAYAVVISLLSYSGLYPHIAWVGVATPLAVTILLVFSVYHFKRSLFAWPAALTGAIAFGQAFTLLRIPWTYLPAAWVGVAFAYMLGERLLKWFLPETGDPWLRAFRWPLGLGAIALAILGLALTAQGTFTAFVEREVENAPSLILAQMLAVGLAVLAAALYRSRWPLYVQPWLAFFPVTLFFIGYSEAIMGQALSRPRYGLVWICLGLLEVLAATLLDQGAGFRRAGDRRAGKRRDVRYAHGLYLAAYALTAFGVLWSLNDRATLVWTLGLWILLAIASALLVHANNHYSWDDLIAVFFRDSESTARAAFRGAFLWLAAGPFPAWCVFLLLQLNVGSGYEWLGFAVPALLLFGLALWLRRSERTYAWPLHTTAQAYTLAGLLISAPFTLRFLAGRYSPAVGWPYANAFMILQTLGVLLYAAFAWVSGRRFFAYIAAWLSLLPVTMFFVNHGAWLFGQPLTWRQFGLVWAGWGLLQVVVAVLLDRLEKRHAHGPFLAGYALAAWAVFWSIPDRPVLVWTLGLWVTLTTGSAFLVHLKRHHSWDNLVAVFFRDSESTARTAFRGAFLWLAAGPFPAWCVFLLLQLNVGSGYEWLGFAVPALLLFGLALWLRRYDRTYAWPLHITAQAYTLAGLLISAPFTVRFLAGRYSLETSQHYATAYMLLQALAVVLYTASARVFGRRFFAHIAAWLSLVPYTLVWIVYGPPLARSELAWIWIGWAAVLLGVGFALDRAKERYSHGPYLAGHALAAFALIWSMPDRRANLYTMGGAIVLALLSQVAVHFGRHRTFDDLLGLIQLKPNTVAQRAARIGFLWFAAYAFPIWLVSLLVYHDVELPWRGVALALAAPIYVAVGLALRRVKAEYTWPLFSVGYALTAIGAMVTFENEMLAIYVLALDAAVYAVSAYIFRQPAWLYLSNLLAPAIALLILHYNFDTLPVRWVAGIFIGLAFVYFGAGQLLDWTHRGKATEKEVTPFAVPFYLPGYLLSALALAVASREQYLALIVYSAGVLLYALSAWRLGEALFLYPAACLAVVPYYVTMTLIGALPPIWYGLGYLPLVVGYVAIGRFLFKGTIPAGWSEARSAVTRPATPFYLMAYGLSVSMMVISRHEPLPLTLASVAAAAVYFASAALFRRPIWLYPGLLATHLALGAYFLLDPERGWLEAHTMALPFHGLTWVIALIGYGFSRLFPVAQRTATGKLRFKLGRWELELGWFPFAGHLIAPSWAQAFFIFGTMDLIFWQVLSLFHLGTAITLATGSALLLGLLAMLWQDTTLGYGTAGFFLLGAGLRLHQAGLPPSELIAWLGGIGLGLFLLARAAERVVAGLTGEGPEPAASKLSALAIWPRPLSRVGLLLSTLAALATLPSVAQNTYATALALAFAGALYLTLAFHQRNLRLGYLGVGLLEVSWVLFLITRELKHPQLYAIPAGLYLAGVGFLERRTAIMDLIQRRRRLFALITECLGLAVLLLTSFIQSLNGKEGLPFFLLLLVEGLLVIWWGAARRARISFFIGIGASVVNVIAQVVVLFTVYKDITLIRWLIILGVGLFLVVAGVFVERQRERIIARTKEWREALEQWD